MSKQVLDKQQTSKSKRKGPSKEIALKNLARAHQKTRQSKQTSIATIDTYMSANKEAVREYDKQTCKAIMYGLGDKLSKLVEQSSKETLLKNSYGVKSISDAYQSYLKLVYPSGIEAHDSSHLSHLLGSILPEFNKSLAVNIQVNMSASHDSPHHKQSRVKQSSIAPESVIDVSPPSEGEESSLSSQP